MNLNRLLLLFTLQCAMLTNAASVDISLEIRDAQTFNRIDKIVEVSIYTENGNELIKGAKAINGRFIAAIEFKKKIRVLQVHIVDESGYYRVKKSTLYLGKKKSVSATSDLIPSETILEKWYAAEDSIYGKVDEGVLSQEFNTNELTSGCDSSAFVDAEFIGGASSFRNYLNESVRYPNDAVEMGEQGRVYVSFVIEATGEISHVRVVKGVSEAIDFEAFRVIKSMPKWIPASCLGKPLRSLGKIPIAFILK